MTHSFSPGCWDTRKGRGYKTSAVTVSSPMQTGVFGGRSGGSIEGNGLMGGGEGEPVRSITWRSEGCGTKGTRVFWEGGS